MAQKIFGKITGGIEMRNKDFTLPCEVSQRDAVIIKESISREGMFLFEVQHHMVGAMGVILNVESIEKLRDQLNIILEESK